MGGSQTPSRAEVLEQLVFEKLVRGDSSDVVLARLQAQFDEATANAALAAALARIQTLKSSGEYESAEIRVRMEGFKSKHRLLTGVAILLITLGALGSVAASLAHGRLAMAIAPIVVCVLIIVFARRRWGSTGQR